VDAPRLEAPKFQWEDKKPKARRPPTTEYMTLNLTRRCVINGLQFGPGTVRVREDIGRCLGEMESRSKEEFASWFLPQPRSAIVYPGGLRHNVPASTFDQALNNALPIVTIDQNGVRDR